MPPDVPEIDCDFCGDTFPEDNAVFSPLDQTLCVGCDETTPTCTSCGWRTHEVRLFYPLDRPGRQHLCDMCVDDLIRCEDCGEVSFGDYMEWDDNYERYYCNGCSEGRHRNRLHSWNYRPDFRLVRAPEESELQLATFFGVELETDHVPIGDVIEAIERNTDLAYCKSDGSLDNGAEIVTHPGTLAAWQQGLIFKWDTWDEASSAFSDQRYEDSAGIHVHVSRTAFEKQPGRWSAAHLWKFMQLHQRNAAAFAGMSGRQTSGYASWNPADDRQRVMKNSKLGDQDDRYRVINVNNDATVECRYFQSDERKEIILKNIELVHAAVEYTRHLTKADVVAGGLQFRRFKDWFADRIAVYPNLNAFWLTLHSEFLDECEARAEREDERFRQYARQQKEREAERRHLYQAFGLSRSMSGYADPYFEGRYVETPGSMREFLRSSSSNMFLRWELNQSDSMRGVVFGIMRDMVPGYAGTHIEPNTSTYWADPWMGRNEGADWRTALVAHGWDVYQALDEVFGIQQRLDDDDRDFIQRHLNRWLRNG